MDSDVTVISAQLTGYQFLKILDLVLFFLKSQLFDVRSTL